MMHEYTPLQIKKIRFTVFLNASVAEALEEMPRKKRHQFVNESLQHALLRENLLSHLEMFKEKKTDFKKGQRFLNKIRDQWRL